MANTDQIQPISLQSIQEQDLDFLFEVYASTRDEELQKLGWDKTQKQAFLEQQFMAQHKSYHLQYPNATYDLIMAGETPIGRLYVDRRPQEIRVLDIALLPNYRGAGIGTKLLKKVQFEAAASQKVVRHCVEHNNPRAYQLYQRLGFQNIEDLGTHFLMEWVPYV